VRVIHQQAVVHGAGEEGLSYSDSNRYLERGLVKGPPQVVSVCAYTHVCVCVCVCVCVS
jgi:hypothetical protein